jgi:lysophospholipase L1-like esterase
LTGEALKATLSKPGRMRGARARSSRCRIAHAGRNNAASSRTGAHEMSERGKNLLLLSVTAILTLLVCEAALRLWHGVSLLDFSNFRARQVFKIILTEETRYDAALGWSLGDGLNKPGFHTVEYGVRRNSAAQTGLRTGTILAVGGSFTEGYQVTDEQSWPAQLERMTGTPVDNAAVPGYALDQIVLRAEQLMPVARPQVLLVAVGDANILWNGASAKWGGAKPYFTAEHGTLLIRNVPPLLPKPESDPFAPVKTILGYSHLANRLMLRIDPDRWLADSVTVWGRVDNDPIDVSCRLLQRLKQQTDSLAIRTLLVPEFSAWEISSAVVPPARVMQVEECARAAGYQIVDTFNALRAAYQSEPTGLNDLYLKQKDHLGHFSELGNRRIAETVAAALASAPVLAGPQ